MEKNYLGDNCVSGKSVTAEHVKSQGEDGGNLLWKLQQFRLETINKTKI